MFPVRVAIIVATILFFTPLIMCGFIAEYFVLDLFTIQMNSSPFITLFTLSCSFAQLVFITLYLLTVLGIRNRYEKINQLLNQNVKISDILKSKNQDSLIKYRDTLRKLSILHLRAHQMVSLINQIFSTPIMVSFGFYTSSGVFSLYELFSIYSLPNVTPQQIGFGFIVSSWWPNAVCVMIMEIWCCMAAVNQGNRTTKILRHILCKEKDGKIRKRLQLFLQQVTHSRPAFSCGLFEFHWESLGIVS
ncbi:hypothetical protein ACKWTF_016291 [Chironomus riparius]